MNKETQSMPTRTRITLRVNGSDKHIDVEPWTILLDALREYLDLTGTKKGATMANAEPAQSWWTASASTHV